jgi:hypothetical protein
MCCFMKLVSRVGKLKERNVSSIRLKVVMLGNKVVNVIDAKVIIISMNLVFVIRSLLITTVAKEGIIRNTLRL